MSLSISTVIKLATAARLAASANQAGVDLSSLTGKCIFVLNSSAGESAGHTLDCKLQHSADNGGSDPYVDAGVVFNQVTNAAASFQQITQDVDGLKRYVRVVDTLAGSTPFVTRSVEVVGKAA